MVRSSARTGAVALVIALATAACSANDAGDGGTRDTAPDENHTDANGVTCGLLPLGDADSVDTGSLGGDLIQLSAQTYECAQHVVVAGTADDILAGAQLAAALRGPLLMADSGLDAELNRLEPAHIYLIGEVDLEQPGDAELRQVNATEAADLAADALQTEPQPAQVADAGGATMAEVIQAIAAGDRVIATEETDATAAADTQDSGDPAPDTVADALANLPAPETADDVWLVDASEPAAAVAVAPVATAHGAAVIPVDGTDLFRHADIGGLLAGQDPDSVRLIGEVTADVEWQLPVVTSGHELPGGGFELFPDDLQRTFIAFYGHPDSAAMGALGQQDGPESTFERMQPLLDDYAELSDVVVPTFNVIATVAHNGGSTSRPDEITDFTSPRYVDFSTMHPPSRFQGWADAAAEIDGYFMMDFQPGRNDFLYQVRHYDELVRMPHAGVALDPEWRLGPNQQHLQQIGHVTADEINEVIEWMADLVRSEGLPPKILLLHQFRLSMIQDRDEIIDRDEVAVVIQMDGEGQTSLAQKDETWRVITAGTEGSHWHWGWKNFFERDTPGPNTPEDTMSKEPTPVYVSYQ